MVYKYLYQDKSNQNLEGEIKARSRDEAYALLRKQGIRPYRVIGEDPWNWRPWAIGAGYAALGIAWLATVLYLLFGSGGVRKPQTTLSDEEARVFRERAEEAVARAPEAYRYNVWKGVNARLEERGLEPLPKPAGMLEDEMLGGEGK